MIDSRAPARGAQPIPHLAMNAINAGAAEWPTNRIIIVELKTIYETTTRHFLSPVKSLLDDESVSEIMINGPETIFFERSGVLHRFEGSFPSNASLMAAARNIAQYVDRSIDGDEHSMDARLPDGSRVHVIVPPSSRQGVCLTVRKFKKSSFDMDTLVEWKSITQEVAEFLKVCVKLHKNIIIAGGTGTGKTSMLNAMSTAIPETERIVVIEDSSELQLYQPHTVYLEAQPPNPDGRGAVSIRDLFVDSLRMRPDRIVVGEVRRGEALDLIQSMLSGHDGSLATVHASTPSDSAVRLETLSLMSDVAIPVHVARSQVASAVHLVVQLTRLGSGRRCVTEIAECLGLDEHGNYKFSSLFRLSSETDDEQQQLVWTGVVPRFSGQYHAMGMTGNHCFGEADVSISATT